MLRLNQHREEDLWLFSTLHGIRLAREDNGLVVEQEAEVRAWCSGDMAVPLVLVLGRFAFVVIIWDSTV